MKNLFTAIIFLTILVSCATMKPVDMPLQTRDEYPIQNMENTANIGDTLVKKAILTYVNGIEIKSLGSVKGFGWNIQIYPGFKYPAGQTDDLDLFYFGPRDMVNTALPAAYIAVDRKSGRLGVIGRNPYGFLIPFHKLDVEPNYKKAKKIDTDSPGFSQEIIYNGKTDDFLKFVYREFSSDMARPAFNQNVQYDLSDGDIIGFKEVRIKIIEATNTHVKYKVLKHFDWKQ